MPDNLFQTGDFKLHSGKTSLWKVECDALTPDDWHTLALMASEKMALAQYGTIIGIPRGGLPFALAIRRLRLDRHEIYGTRALVVDDVYTTGASIEEYMRAESSITTFDILVAFDRSGSKRGDINSIWKY